MINGNIEGLKETVIEELESLYELECGKEEFISFELAQRLADLSCRLEREISVFLSRGGRVLDVSVGSRENVSLPMMRKRRGTLGLSGVRCIHTHPGGSSQLSSVDIGTLLSTRMDSMAALSVSQGKPKSLCAGFIGEQLTEAQIAGPFPAFRIPGAFLMAEIERTTIRVANLIRLQDTGSEREKAMLIGLDSSEAGMKELARLADTAGAEVVLSCVQSRQRDRGTYIGKGKARELALSASALDADLAIFDDELTPIEEKNLEEILGLKIVDRTTLILDIFARHAKSREGRLQVELAQLKYNLPRLVGEGTSLSRLGGGIGTRGPGESKLEVDRRRIRRRIYELQREIEKLSEQRELRRENREKNRAVQIALVGYTNAGKSSLLSALSGTEVYAEDKLFATLDPLTRKVQTPSGKEVLFTDTVGFIEKLPHDLIDAFRSTLEEAVRADLLVLVVDAADEQNAAQVRVVREVLAGLGAGKKPIVFAYNKADLLENIPEPGKDSVYISAREGLGIEELLEKIQEKLRGDLVQIELVIDYADGAKLDRIRKCAEQVDVEYGEKGISVKALMQPQTAKRILRQSQITSKNT